MMNPYLESFTKEELMDLIEIYSKNWLAMDGLWFQRFEKTHGMDEAMDNDCKVWEDFTVIEANKIKKFLSLPERSGFDGLEKALKLRFYANFSKDEIIRTEDSLIYRMLECRVQHARERKGMDFHPCKPVGIIEYGDFAKTIDDRFECECLSCFPDVRDKSCHCAWEFKLREA